jgi:hypothetical protein
MKSSELPVNFTMGRLISIYWSGNISLSNSKCNNNFYTSCVNVEIIIRQSAL